MKIKLLAATFFLSVVALGIWGPAIAKSEEVASVATSEENLENPAELDTWVCPSLSIMTDHYLVQGLSEKTDGCSVFSSASFEYIESLGTYPVGYGGEVNVEEPVDEYGRVEVFKVRIGNLKLYAIAEWFDEHLLEENKVGRLPGVAYEVWGGVSSSDKKSRVELSTQL